MSAVHDANSEVRWFGFYCSTGPSPRLWGSFIATLTRVQAIHMRGGSDNKASPLYAVVYIVADIMLSNPYIATSHNI